MKFQNKHVGVSGLHHHIPTDKLDTSSNLNISYNVWPWQECFSHQPQSPSNSHEDSTNGGGPDARCSLIIDAIPNFHMKRIETPR